MPPTAERVYGVSVAVFGPVLLAVGVGLLRNHVWAQITACALECLLGIAVLMSVVFGQDRGGVFGLLVVLVVLGLLLGREARGSLAPPVV